MSVAVTGARGLLGGAVMRAFGALGGVVGWSSGDHPGYRRVDVRAAGQVAAALDGDRPDVVVHCAADPDIASCEADPVAARELNALAVRTLAVATRARGIALVQISTDYVFSGTRDGYPESAEPDPLQVYGRTKAEAERYCLDVADGLVVRLPLLFGPAPGGRATFPEQVIRALRAGEPVVADAVEVRQPTLTTDVADVLTRLVDARVTGIVHVAAQQGVTKHAWARLVADLAGLDAELVHRAAPREHSNRPTRSFLLDERLRQLGIPAPRTVRAATEAFLAGTT